MGDTSLTAAIGTPRPTLELLVARLQGRARDLSD
jgi:hypothetical protein